MGLGVMMRVMLMVTVSAYLAEGIMVECGRCFAGRDFRSIYCMNGGFERMPDLCPKGYLHARDMFLQDNFLSEITQSDIRKFSALQWLNVEHQRSGKCVSVFRPFPLDVVGACETPSLSIESSLPRPIDPETELNLTMEILSELDIDGVILKSGNESDFFLDIIKKKIKEKVKDTVEEELVEILTPLSSLSVVIVCVVYVYVYCRRVRGRTNMPPLEEEEMRIVDTANTSQESTLSNETVGSTEENNNGAPRSSVRESESATAAAAAAAVMVLGTLCPSYNASSPHPPTASSLHSTPLIPPTPPPSEIEQEALSPLSDTKGNAEAEEEEEEVIFEQVKKRTSLPREAKDKAKQK